MKERLPVIVLTGFLGSGKTTRLRHWLQTPALQSAVLIINELGEVGVDQQTLRGMTEQTRLLANQCVCCTGLAGLEDVLEELKWRILNKTQAAPPCLIIETTGIADPAPILYSLKNTLAHDYELRACICCLAADTAAVILASDPIARQQLDAASQILITKADIAPAEAACLMQSLQTRYPHCPITLDQLDPHTLRSWTRSAAPPRQPLSEAPTADTQTKPPAHHAHYQSWFEPIGAGLSRSALIIAMHRLLEQNGYTHTRLKGFVQLDDQRFYRVEHAPASRRIDLEHVEQAQGPTGVTLIRALN